VSKLHRCTTYEVEVNRKFPHEVVLADVDEDKFCAMISSRHWRTIGLYVSEGFVVYGRM
jgi:hypothetical protein